MFLRRFLIGSIWNAGFVCALLALKKLLGNRVSLRFHYYSWFLLIPSLVFPFFPGELWSHWLKIPLAGQQTMAAWHIPDGAAAGGTQWMQDTTLLMESDAVGSSLGFPILAIWLTGVAVCAAYYGCGSWRLRQIAQFAGMPSPGIQPLFQACCQKLGLTQTHIQLRQSRFIAVPISFGCRSPLVVLPKARTDELPKAQLEHILLHELTHIRHRDWPANCFVCLVQALYWFHPLVWLAFRQLRRDREAYCDWTVLNLLEGEPERIAYGHTLLSFSAGNGPQLRTANGLCQNKRQLTYRLEQVIAFRRETKWRKMLGQCLSLALAAACILQIPLMALCAENSGEYYVPSQAIATEEGGWDDLFTGYRGCAVVYDLSGERCTVYNEAEITRRVPPCSTFKIYSALNALEQGIISPEDSALPWDGEVREFASWNRGHDLTSAMQQSVNWYFQALDQAAGIDTLSSFYRRIGYGNGQVGADPAAYWNGSALKISAWEQVMLLAKLYRNDFGFSSENIRAVTDSLLLASTPSYRLYGKTGTGSVGHTNVAGWFVGYAETAGSTHFFAVYFCADSGADGATAVSITTEILNRLGIEISAPI